MYHYLIVGAGLCGSVMAQQLREAGKRVLVIEKRGHIAGNAYTRETEGIQVHVYGAHIFHTDLPAVWKYMNRFAEFNRYVHSPAANCRGEVYSLPFSMYTFQRMWGVTEPEEARKIIAEQRKEIAGTPRNLEEQAISLVGRDIYEKLIRGYTEKQWGRACAELPAFIIRRLPVRFTYDNRYFSAAFQGIPEGGYTRLVRNMLDGIEVVTGADYLKDREYWDSRAERVVFTVPVDAYFSYALGALEYRSVRFETETLGVPDFQGNAVINYTDRETPYTRIIEHKWFTFGKDPAGRELPGTVISREYSSEWKPGDEPYYPINDERNDGLYRRYAELARKESRTVFCGRLGEYRYYDMDQVVDLALRKSRALLSGETAG